MSNAYYQDELRYLRDVGPEFARNNPEIARFLADRGSDPDVERLLEGVAFLCGRIRQKLDDELPELTANIMGLLWPHYVRPIPSMAILELLPDVDSLQAPLVVEAGAEFASVPVDGTQCRYRSSWRTKLRPWLVEEARLDTTAARPLRLLIRLRCSPKVTLDTLELDAVRLHLAGDPLAALTLYMLLAGHVESVSVSDGSASSTRRELSLARDSIVPAGLDRSDGVLPYPAHSFLGYRLLQEFFTFKDRFLFAEVRGLDRAVERLELTSTLELAVTFNRRLETYPMVSRDNLRLHCVPIINLFSHPADPIRLEHDRTQYLVLPSKSGVADRRHLEVYAVEQVLGLAQDPSRSSRRYEPFYSFRHLMAADPTEARYYQTHVRPNVFGGDLRRGTDTYMSFVSGGAGAALPVDETISIELTCTNRDLPAALRAGDICQATDSSPAGTRFRNLLKPTATIAPPLGKALHWRLISHMSLNYVSLADVKHLKEVLRVYDFQSEYDAQRAMSRERMLEGLLKVEAKLHERFIRGAPVRGMQVAIELNEEYFAGEGDAYLFSAVLDRFLGLYVTVNAYSQLTVRFARSGYIYSFPARWGEQLTPAGMKVSA